MILEYSLDFYFAEWIRTSPQLENPELNPTSRQDLYFQTVIERPEWRLCLRHYFAIRHIQTSKLVSTQHLHLIAPVGTYLP